MCQRSRFVLSAKANISRSKNKWNNSYDIILLSIGEFEKQNQQTAFKTLHDLQIL
jgi:hypothetical protein